MERSEKIEIIAYALTILAIFTLVQSPMLNAIGVFMVFRLLFRLKNIYKRPSGP